MELPLQELSLHNLYKHITLKEYPHLHIVPPKVHLKMNDSREQWTVIETIQAKLFPLMNAVEEGRAVVAKLDDQRPTHIGDVLDPQSVVDNEEAEEEGLRENEDHVGRYPTDAIRKLDEPRLPESRGIFKMVAIPKDDAEYERMRAAARSLDDDQRIPYNMALKLVRQDRASSPGNRPDPIFLKIHGGAGSGKSHLINTVATSCEYYWRIDNKEMDDPQKPVVLKLAPTGKAATGIDGMTMHQAFNFKFGIKHYSLSEQVREMKRNALSYLKLVIIDEMSMIKPDQLYQLHMRLQEIKQNRRLFGGVSVILSGDLMQLPPVKSPQIFEAPKNEIFRRHHEISPLWDVFDSIELTHNHRQAEDWEYAELLNRVRMNDQTEKDLETLASKISDDSPQNAVYVFAKRDLCHVHNKKQLADLPSRLHTMRAIHPRGFRPLVNDEGEVDSTSFMDNLQLKIGARIMLIHNVDTMDHLSNGTCGYVKGFVWSEGEHQEIMKVLVEFDDPRAGENLRLKHPRHPKQPRSWTPIARVSFEYGLGDPEKDHAKTKLMQFPIQLAWAITAHKCQGMTIKPPTKLVADLDSCWKNSPGMAYVMLGRIQNLNQLILRWSYDPIPKSDALREKKRAERNIKAARKIQANGKAMVEAQKITQYSLNNKTDDFLTDEGLKIASINVQGGLVSRLADLEADKAVYKNCDIICLQETGPLKSKPKLEGYICEHGGSGHKRGVAMLLKEKMTRQMTKRPLIVSKDFYQCMKVSFRIFDLITVYRANNQPSASFKEFVQIMAKGIDSKRPTILCGDLNFDQRIENDFTRMLKMKKFVQIVREPTTYRGYCIDHLYHNIADNGEKVVYKLHYPCYSDHEAVCVRIPIFGNGDSN